MVPLHQQRAALAHPSLTILGFGSGTEDAIVLVLGWVSPLLGSRVFLHFLQAPNQQLLLGLGSRWSRTGVEAKLGSLCLSCWGAVHTGEGAPTD